MAKNKLTCFKAYDIRGRVPDALNADIARRIAWGMVKTLNPQSVVIGYDVREHSHLLQDAMTQVLITCGVKVTHIGLSGTEEVVFHTANGGYDAGVMITASHNPIEYNGMKIVGKHAAPIFGETLDNIRQYAEQSVEVFEDDVTPQPHQLNVNTDKTAYITKLLSFINLNRLKPYKIVVNPGNGCAGPVLALLEQHLPFDFVYLNRDPDGRFPHGVPNPMLPKNREHTSRAIKEHEADLGLAWDGDFDRCFFFDEYGAFVEGYYVVGLLVNRLLQTHPSSAVVYDPRLVWNTQELIGKHTGTSCLSKSGHTFMKHNMRKHDAIYGGELSAHHYFRDFYYSDSGMVPWLLITELMSSTGSSLADMVSVSRDSFPCSDEINFTVDDCQETMARVLEHYKPLSPCVSTIDGISLEFDDWRFNLRASNTEPLLRLNVETRSNPGLLHKRVKEICSLCRQVEFVA